MENTKLWDDYQNGMAYQATIGISKKIPMYVKFYEGDQWPQATEHTKNLPRPVINIVKMICRAKKASILSTPVKLVYKSDSETERFNRFADYITAEMGQVELDRRAMDDGVKKGTYIYHYYWDSEAKGKDGIKEGGLRCELIDPLNIFFSNPTEPDEQKQKWILIASREDVESVKAKCDRNVDKNCISSDESSDKYDTKEQEGNKLVTVLTRYFRKDGEVYCEKGTQKVLINKPFPITPDLESAAVELGFDAPNNDLPDNHKKTLNKNSRSYLYPIVVGNYEPREKSIYGLSEVEGLIPNQKSINFNIAMALLNTQQVAWGKYIVLPNALGGQSINNEPGQVLIDYSNTGHGISKMKEEMMQSLPLSLVDNIMTMTRTVTGSTEVMTGEVMGANMSGAAIAQLQSQAQQPIEDLKNAFWQVKRKQGLVLIQFFKLYYNEKEYTYEENNIRLPDIYEAKEFEQTEFDVVVETTAGTKASAAGDINILDTLLNKGAISVRTYIESYPDDALSSKTDLLSRITSDENSQIMQLTQQVDALQQRLAQSAELLQKQKDTVDKVVSLIQENSSLKTLLANLYAEAKTKINYSNQVIQASNAKIQETTEDATAFAEEIYAQEQRKNPEVSNDSGNKR